MSVDQIKQIETMLRCSPELGSMTIEEMRLAFDQIGQVTPAGNDVGVNHHSVNGVPCVGIHSGEVRSDKTILFFHSGGYVMGSHRGYIGALARLGQAADANILFPEYRLAPEHPYPAAVDDAFAVYRGLLDEGRDPGSIAVSGDSAGGGLALAMLLRARAEGLPMPSSAALFSPFADLSGSGETIREKAAFDLVINTELMDRVTPQYLAGTDPATPEVSPVFADLTGFPPLLLHVGTYEMLLDDTLRLARRAAIANVSVTMKAWPRLQHLWQLYANILDEGQQSLVEAGIFINEHLE